MRILALAFFGFGLIAACSSDETKPGRPDSGASGPDASAGARRTDAGVAGHASGTGGQSGKSGGSGNGGGTAGADAGKGDGGRGTPDASIGMDGSTGGAVVTDAGAGYVESDDIRQLVSELAKLKAGDAADLDGDGTADTTRTVDNGVITLTGDHDGDGTPEFLLTIDGKGKSTYTIDADQDGVPEEEIVVTSTATTQTRVDTADTDRDGKMDQRETWVTNKSSLASQQYTREQDSAETGAFKVVSTATLTSTKTAPGGSCDGSDGFPSGGTDYQPFPGSPNIKTGSGGGECNSQDAGSIAAALDCALSKGALCLANTNTKEYNSLMAAANGDSMMPLDIGCGNGCGGVLAATRGWAAPWFSDSTMNINPSEWNMLDADGKCNIMLHELMHWGGDQGSADHNDPNGPGDDDVYSCGRYCGKCSDAGHGSPGNSSVDCARCADTAERKTQCGSKQQYKTGDCQGELTGLCHAGLGCIAGDCEVCGKVETDDCDGTVVSVNATCCQTCPATCNSSNDLACTGTPTLDNTCTDGNPPFCH